MRSSVVLPVLVVCLLLLSGCGKQQEAVQNFAELKGHLDVFSELVLAGDVDGLEKLYAEDPPPIGFYMWGQRIEGRDAVVQGWRDLFEREAVQDLAFDKVQYRMKNNLGVIWGLCTMTTGAGEDQRKIEARFTRVLGRRDTGTWEVLHDHVSIPVPMGGSTAPEEMADPPEGG